MITWYHLIDNATSIPEVVGVARDYIASWTPQEIALLPERCRPGKVRDAYDIELLHDCVIEEYRDSLASGEGLSRLQELTSFLVQAMQRITDLSARNASGASGKPSRVSPADSAES
jgi:hypothetical protein